MVAVYLSLLFAGLMPLWLVIAVTARDLLIVGAVNLSWIMASRSRSGRFSSARRPPSFRSSPPRPCSARRYLRVRVVWVENGMIVATAILTLLSGGGLSCWFGSATWRRRIAHPDRRGPTHQTHRR
ncbi:MAG: hypothetical protein HPM95_17120 [Alphaproteobacteria bacterium]|nr:hypothetical protein [Alphaproteobacteria bacterium]